MSVACSIDRQTVPGLLSVTFMSGAIVKVSSRASLNRRSLIGRTFLLVLIPLLCVNLLFAGQGKPKKLDGRHQIDLLEEQWRTAVLNNDTSALSSLLADDYIAITASGTLQNKEEAITNMRNRRVHFTSLDVSDRKVRFYGSAALVNSLAQVKATMAEGEVAGSFRYTRVYARDAQGHWKIVSFEASRIHPQNSKKMFQDTQTDGK
jgi:ketosteroid isomerase-like protein